MNGASKNSLMHVGEMAQWIRIFPALTDVLVPALKLQSPLVTPGAEDLTPSFGLLRCQICPLYA